VPPAPVVVSNRGPVAFGDDGTAGRAAGGLVVAVGPGATRHRALWVAAALTAGDRRAAGAGPLEAAGHRVQLVDLDPAAQADHYEVVANGTLWYLHHGLWDLSRQPRFDRRWHEAWGAYRAVNERFADEVAAVAADGATVLVQDYHLALVAGMLAKRRPDLRTATFVHTPWCTPEELAVLPDEAAAELVGGLVDGGPVGFHSARWARRFEACADALPGQGRPRTFVAPAAPDVAQLSAVAGSAACDGAVADLDRLLAGRRLITRVDRVEPSKNALRGLWAFEALLEEHPEWVDRVTFGVFVYPSRQGMADYQALGREIEALAGQLNRRWARPGWTPVLLDLGDDHTRSVAALRRYDALLVNPVRDGLNLVAVEGPAVNERDGAVVLSAQAGAADVLTGAALVVNPFDVRATADALAAALGAAADERTARAAALRRAVARLDPLRWWDAVVAAAGS
jgi:trehalose 6-phosphate synthase